MELSFLAKVFNIDAVVCDFMEKHDWAEAEKSYCDIPALLDEKNILNRWNTLQLRHDPAPLLAAVKRALQSEELKHLFHYLDFYWWKSSKCEIYGYRLPRFTDIAGEEEGALLGLALALAGCDAIEKTFARLGIPREYALAAEERINADIISYQTYHDGKLGYAENGHHWMRFFVEGKLFRLGRLEFMIEPAPLIFAPAVYRRRSDGAVIALARHDWKFNADGWRLWRGDDPAGACCTAELQTAGDCIRGIPIHPAGYAEIGKTVVLNKKDFDPLWSDWDLVPDLHIPPGGNMTLSACLDSLQQALEFFPRYFRRTPAAFTSFSWIFNPDFIGVLPESNISKFMQELYLSPLTSNGQDGLWFVFGRSAEDWSNFPADNSIRRAFHELRKQGRRLKTGGMFIEAGGIADFGNQHYRKNYIADEYLI